MSGKNESAAVSPDRLLDFASAVYCACGLSDKDARLAADTLVQADLWGHQSHGVMRLSWYVARLRSGVVLAKAVPELIVDAGAIAILDGKDAMGQVVAEKAARQAIGRAKAHGIGAVAVRNSNHFGTAMYFTRMAAAQGCVGFLSTNASPAMAPWGGREKRVGNNPWSWAAPAGDKVPFVLDIANTAVARGKIYLARQKGLPIPEGWAIDAEGAPTTDPVAALDGMVMPIAGHKGYAISAAMDMLSGVLTGAKFLSGVTGPYQAEKKGSAGHFMMALNIEAFQTLDEFAARMGEFIAELKSTALAQGTGEIFYPGEIEARNETKNRAEGLILPGDTLADLAKLGREFGLALPFDPAQ